MGSVRVDAVFALLILCPVLLILLYVFRQIDLFWYLLLFPLLLLPIIVSFLYIVFFNCKFEFAALVQALGIVRLFVVGIFFQYMLSFSVLKSKEVFNVIRLSLFFIILIGLGQFFSPTIKEITLNLYLSSVRDLSTYNILDAFRITSTLGHPSIFGLACILFLVLTLEHFTSNKPSFAAVLLPLVGVVAGLLSFTKSFILGLFLLMFYYLIVTKKFLIKTVVTSLVLFLSLTFYLLSNFFDLGRQLLGTVMSDGLFVASLGSRFGDDGILKHTYRFWADTFFLGSGFNIVPNLFVGDNLYLSLAIRGSIFAVLAFILIFCYFFIFSFRKYGLVGVYTDSFLVYLVLGIGTNTITSTRLGEYFFIIIALFIFDKNKLCFNQPS